MIELYNIRVLCESIAERIVSWIIARQCAESAWRRSRNFNRPCHPKTDPSFPPLIFDQISESGAQLITARYYCGSDINLSLRVQPNFPRCVNVGTARRVGRAWTNLYTKTHTRHGTRGTLQSPLTFRVSSVTAYSALVITKVNAPLCLPSLTPDSITGTRLRRYLWKQRCKRGADAPRVPRSFGLDSNLFNVHNARCIGEMVSTILD